MPRLEPTTSGYTWAGVRMPAPANGTSTEVVMVDISRSSSFPG
ncbi:hypothetical protein [Streptomyces sp. TLI_171]|nr:hypothetical protein [Streptomyces sp. TLI_171]